MDSSFHEPEEMAGYLGFLMHRKRVESSAALLQYFGFEEDPFRVSPDPRYMFPSQTHLEALASLENGFYNDRGFIAMIAPPGMGKTTLLYKFLQDTRATARSVFLFDIDSGCKPRDFVSYILREFGVTPAQSSSEMHSQLGEVLVKETEAGRKCVVVIDEAQNLSDAVLERVRLLTNFETSQGKLLQIILSGQPQLTDKLLQASLVQLRQRISTVCRLELLTPAETADYIDYRLRQAGYQGNPLFTQDALKLIVENSKGTPRTINNLCFNALSLCSARGSKQVEGEMVAKVIANLELFPQLAAPVAAGEDEAAQKRGLHQKWSQVQPAFTLWSEAANIQMKLWIPATAAVLLLGVLGVLRLSGVGDSQPRTEANDRPLNPAVTGAPPLVQTVAKPRKPTVTKPITTSKTSDLSHAAGNHLSAALPQASEGKRSTSLVAAANPATLQRSSAADTRAPGQASLSIYSMPAGADIEIDGAFVGSTPSTITIARGSHRVTVNKKGYGDWSKTLSVSGGTVRLNAELEQETPKQ